ncbi:MAG: FAD-dependent oxidoreductase, partial [Deltaproteobacteria bacterium]|nr:FAD-dependent oxidoreductase [Deltaproteobacteria bacterium]
MRQPRSLEQLETYRQGARQRLEARELCVRICTTGCRAYGALEVKDRLVQEIAAQGLEQKVEVRSTGCHGLCAKAPVLAVDPLDLFYQEVGVADVPELVARTLARGEVVERLLYRDARSGAPLARTAEIPFFRHQVRRVLEGCGRVDPTSIDQYIALDGYLALARVLSGVTPEALIELVKAAGLRGRGGAGFSTGTKWEMARASAGQPKYIVCNADEGDPGAFMDRALLEGDPHRVLEGMILGAYAIGARHGYFYVRAEYPIAVQHLEIAVRQARKLGLLGENILGTPFCFDVQLKQGAGAFVCGEETALMASIEGRRGMPRPRPPFPAQSGLDGRPTNINNVETFANIRSIVLLGAQEFARYGTERSKGTKIFSLAGKVNHTGLVEVPVGTTMRTVIFEIGGGIPKGRRFKAVQMGGPSGGCVPEKYLDMPIDYDSLQSIGSIMGSGGMVVMDENTCMVEIARFFLAFTQSESCGKCAPCRLGTRQLLAILDRITRGRGTRHDFDRLHDITTTLSDAALCGLGQTCPKPVLSTLRFFEEEYAAHIDEKRCPAGVCDALMISPCQHTCPVGVNVPEYVAHIRAGRFAEAIGTIWQRNPFPAICGRICAHPCESKCRRGELDDPVSIRSLKRMAADWYFRHVDKPPPPFPVTRSERVAVVGAGPTGLTAAYHLARQGYPVTVFE